MRAQPAAVAFTMCSSSTGVTTNAISRRIAVLALLLAGLAGTAWPAKPSMRVLRDGSFAALLAARREQPFMLVMWSVTCVPCRDEFELLRELRTRYPRLPLVLIATDDVAEEAMAARMIERYGLADEESWIFADDAQKLRYQIDPGWYGELPRTYFYDSAHRRDGVSGSLTRQQIVSWLREQGLDQ